MVGDGSVPCVHGVAIEATGWVAAPGVFFLEIRLVAGHAVVRTGWLEEDRGTPRSMTIRAGQLLVSPRQDIPPGDLRVIEVVPVPTILVVALATCLRVSRP